MIPHHIIYVEPSNIEARSKIVTQLLKDGYNPMVAASLPGKKELDGMVGIVFDQNFKGFRQELFKGRVSAIVWYNCDIPTADLDKLIPFFEAQLTGYEYEFPRSDYILKEFTKPNRDTPDVEEKTDKKIKV